MAIQNGDGQDKDAVATFLGWFSIALGGTQLAAPGALARAIGLKGHDTQRTVMRVMGLREIASGVGILGESRPARWLWARVAGDALDLALLVKADTRSRVRVGGAIAAVAGVTAPDIIEATRLSREDGSSAGGKVHVRKGITVNLPPDDVYGFWRDFQNFPRFMAHLEAVESTGETRSHWRAKAPAGRTVEWDAEVVDERPDELIAWRSLEGADVENSGSVQFRPAPGGRGTEVTVDLRYSPPAGQLGVTLAKLLGEEPATQLSDDLRRFKQVIETGEVVRSDSTPEGHSVRQHLKQRPAQPIGGRA
jgi:uncharacterized membrane protein